MPLKKVQEDVHKWTGQFTPQYWKPHEMFARLVEETGELGREINHLYGPKKKKATEEESSIGEELSDIIFTVGCIANQQKIDLSKEWDNMMQSKMYGRDKDRYQKK